MPPDRIKLVVTDVDGVLTDGAVALDADGRETKFFDIQDGLGVTLLQRQGIAVCFLSSRRSAVVGRRAEELGVELCLSGVRDKGAELDRLLGSPLPAGPRKERIAKEDTCYVGDDLLDLSCLRRVGFPVAVANAREEVKEAAEYVTRARGGTGAFREVAELILKSQGMWSSVLENYR